MPSTHVADAPDRSRYEITADGELAGFAEYHLHEGVIAFTHTEIGDEYGGQGLASQLIRAALDDARDRGLAVEPFCRFVRAFIAKNDEYRDLVPAAQHARFGLT